MGMIVAMATRSPADIFGSIVYQKYLPSEYA
jgi:hypothetical protein